MWRWLLLALLLAALGCSSEYKVVQVSGRVTLNGKPLEGAWVSFQPVGSKDKDPGPGASAKTDKEGRYTLRIEPGRSGALVGKHQVRISTIEYDENSRLIQQERVPARYHALQSELTFVVPKEGTSEANFDLKAP